jgi:ABC-2 type transport system ATP-binding protein
MGGCKGMSIQVCHLKKSFDEKMVLKDINLEIESGQCFLLLGRNGAGKSTLLNIILNLLPFDEGEIKIYNTWFDKNEKLLKKRIGSVPEHLPLIQELNGKVYLEMITKIYDVNSKEAEKRIEEITNYFFEEKSDLDKIISTYSTGMKMKLAICAALLHNPDILILDEPFSGLDVISAHKLIKLLQQFTQKNKIILISSHNLNYVEQFCTHVAVLDEGEIKFQGSMDNFLQDGQKKMDKALLQLLQIENKLNQQFEWLK